MTDSNVLGLTTLATHKKVEELVVPSLPVAAHVHVFVALGSVDLNGQKALEQGTAVRLTDEDTQAITAGPEGAELIVWATA